MNLMVNFSSNKSWQSFKQQNNLENCNNVEVVDDPNQLITLELELYQKIFLFCESFYSFLGEPPKQFEDIEIAIDDWQRLNEQIVSTVSLDCDKFKIIKIDYLSEEDYLVNSSPDCIYTFRYSLDYSDKILSKILNEWACHNDRSFLINQQIDALVINSSAEEESSEIHKAMYEFYQDHYHNLKSNDFLFESLTKVQIEAMELWNENSKNKNLVSNLESEKKIALNRMLDFKGQKSKAKKKNGYLIEKNSKLLNNIAVLNYKSRKNSDGNNLLTKITGRIFNAFHTREIRKNNEKNITLIKNSGLFDYDWYLGEYKDVRESKMDPYLHYYIYGVEEARNPNRFFDTIRYLVKNLDVQESGMHPFVHYIKYGQQENRPL